MKGKQLHRKNILLLIIGAPVLFVIHSFWEEIKTLFLTIDFDQVIRFVWIGLFITLGVYFWKSRRPRTSTLVSGNEQYDIILDFTFSFLRYGAIITAVFALGKELFLHFNFAELSKCKDFSLIDIGSFGACIVVLSLYLYKKLEPIVIDVYFQDKGEDISKDVNISLASSNSTTENNDED